MTTDQLREQLHNINFFNEKNIKNNKGIKLENNTQAYLSPQTMAYVPIA
jgi:hypothetical protein